MAQETGVMAIPSRKEYYAYYEYCRRVNPKICFVFVDRNDHSKIIDSQDGLNELIASASNKLQPKVTVRSIRNCIGCEQMGVLEKRLCHIFPLRSDQPPPSSVWCKLCSKSNASKIKKDAKPKGINTDGQLEANAFNLFRELLSNHLQIINVQQSRFIDASIYPTDIDLVNTNEIDALGHLAQSSSSSKSCKIHKSEAYILKYLKRGLIFNPIIVSKNSEGVDKIVRFGLIPPTLEAIEVIKEIKSKNISFGPKSSFINILRNNNWLYTPSDPDFDERIKQFIVDLQTNKKYRLLRLNTTLANALVDKGHFIEHIGIEMFFKKYRLHSGFYDTHVTIHDECQGDIIFKVDEKQILIEYKTTHKNSFQDECLDLKQMPSVDLLILLKLIKDAKQKGYQIQQEMFEILDSNSNGLSSIDFAKPLQEFRDLIDGPNIEGFYLIENPNDCVDFATGLTTSGKPKTTCLNVRADSNGNVTGFRLKPNANAKYISTQTGYVDMDAFKTYCSNIVNQQ